MVGGIFLAAGVLKVSSPVALASTIAGFQLLPAPLIAPLAMFLPYFEIGLGLYLILGLFVRYVAIVAGIQLTLFAGVVASVVARGLVVSCGCFGPADTAPATWLDVVRDVILAALTIPIILAPPGRLALDQYFERKSLPL